MSDRISKSPKAPAKVNFLPSRIRDILGLAFFLSFTLALSALLLILNAGFCYSIYSSVGSSLPGWLAKPQAGQLILYLLPVALLFVEWYLIDAIIDRVRRW